MDAYPDTKKVVPENLKTGVIPFVLNESKTKSGYKGKIMNSEMKYDCWFIENPITKDLSKKITLKLKAKSKEKFIVVLRTPTLNHPQNILSLINVGLLTFRDEKFGVEENFEDFLD